MESYPHPVNEG